MKRVARAMTATTLVAGCAICVRTVGVPAAQARAGFTNASARVDNPWFPLRPGTIDVSRGGKDGKPARDVFEVTRRTEVIDGVRCAVIDDRLYLAGRLAERTTDWYAQDRDGNVWYLGEMTAVLDAHGKITSTEGSWQAGRHGARPGISMPAHPRVGQAFQQEFYKGHAEDRSRILSVSAHISTPGASSRHALVTRETTPLEPSVVDHKVYVRGTGTVREEAVKGGKERLELVSVRHA